MTAAQPGLPPGTLIDGWRVVKTLGDGGFAIVHHVEKNGQAFALKLSRYGPGRREDEEAHARARREVTILGMLDHPNIVRLHAHGKWPDPKAGHLYAVLDYVEGWTWAEWVQRKHPTFHEVLCACLKIVAALLYMHGKGVLHRDLKPSNVVIRKGDGEPILIDFGCATHTQADDLTESGLHPGTERYRAPEQFTFLRTHKDEHRARYAFQVSDELFAFGAMLYEVLTDPRPTEERERPVLNSAIFTPTPAKKLNPRVPQALSELVMSLLARNPAERPVDTEALRREVKELVADTGQEYTETVHPPSQQRQPAPPEGEEPAARAPTRKRSPGKLRAVGARLVAHARASKPLAVGGMAAAAGLVLAVAVSFNLGEAPEPAPAPREAPAPSGVAPLEPLGSPAATAPQKEGSTVTTQKPEDTQQAPTPRGQKPSTAKCRALPLMAALAAGCTGAQIRPEPFECPSGARDAMFKELGWDTGDQFAMLMDDREGNRIAWLTPGEVVGVTRHPTRRSVNPRHWDLLPRGARFYGRLYVVPGFKQGSQWEIRPVGSGDPPGMVVARYDRVKFEDGREFPVCFVVINDAQEIKDGKALADNAGIGDAVVRWP